MDIFKQTREWAAYVAAREHERYTRRQCQILEAHFPEDFPLTVMHPPAKRLSNARYALRDASKAVEAQPEFHKLGGWERLDPAKATAADLQLPPFPRKAE